MKIHIIGCGGTGSWLAPSLCLLAGKQNIILMDGDKLEEKNLNRQLFRESDVGRFKAEALGQLYGCEYICEWFGFGVRPFARDDWLICCADNHPARAATLEACDYHKCRAIIAANETHSSEAYAYLPQWKDSPIDPRVFYPEILTDTGGDPRRAAIGCTGEAQEQNPQLVSANFSAAALAQHLYVVWGMEARKLKKDVWPHLPHKLVCNLTRLESFKAGR